MDRSVRRGVNEYEVLGLIMMLPCNLLVSQIGRQSVLQAYFADTSELMLTDVATGGNMGYISKFRDARFEVMSALVRDDAVFIQYFSAHAMMPRDQHRLPVLAFNRDRKKTACDVEVLVFRAQHVIAPPTRVLVADGTA